MKSIVVIYGVKLMKNALVPGRREDGK